MHTRGDIVNKIIMYSFILYYIDGCLCSADVWENTGRRSLARSSDSSYIKTSVKLMKKI